MTREPSAYLRWHQITMRSPELAVCECRDRSTCALVFVCALVFAYLRWHQMTMRSPELAACEC